MAWLKAAIFAALVCALALLIHAYGASRFEQGAASRDAALAQAVHRADQLERQNELNARADEVAKQEAIDAQAATYQARLAADQRALAASRAGADQLRDAIFRVAAARADPVSASASAAGGPDGRAAALGDVSASCSALATDLAGEAESLAEQVRGLQAYAREVSAPAPITIPTE